jgi:hypothetical protein
MLRQDHGETDSIAVCGEQQVAPLRVNRAASRRQTHAGSMRLGGEKRFKQMLDRIA